MKIDLEVESLSKIPSRFTGVVRIVAGCRCCDRTIFLKDGEYHREDGPAVEHSNGEKYWYQEGKLHRIDGPAYEDPGIENRWYIDGIGYCSMKLDDEIIVLDYFKGAYNIMWYKILTEDGITECPDIPGLIDKG